MANLIVIQEGNKLALFWILLAKKNKKNKNSPLLDAMIQEKL